MQDGCQSRAGGDDMTDCRDGPTLIVHVRTGDRLNLGNDGIEHPFALRGAKLATTSFTPART